MTTWTKEQKQAIEKSGCNIIVSAGAGSGKTAVLSQRVINKIENNIHVNELLILTFTKAAANEMKDRIRKKIKNNPDFKKELNLLNSAYVTTFDSFALSVVKKYHYVLNIDDDIKITDESIVILEKKKILDELFDELYKQNKSNFIELVNKYCLKNDKLLKESIYKLSNKIENIINIKEFYEYIQKGFYSKENLDSIIEDYKEFINDKKNIIKLELKNLEYYFDSEYMSKLYESISNILNCNIDELNLFTSVSLPKVPNGSSEEAKNYKTKLKKELDELVSYGQYGNTEKIKDDILSARKEVNTIIEIIKQYIERVKLYKTNNNIYTFTDVAFNAIKILKENEEIREELKNQFKEIMIDEYQDTNDIQETFIKLISNNNVYMVGDIKQSIYRFRGSNPSIFKDKYDAYSLNNGGYKIDLIKNFRSRNEVLDNINKIFDLIMDNDLGGAKYKLSHEMIYGNNLYDIEKINNYNYDFDGILYTNNPKETNFTNSEIEIFTIARDIENKIKNKLKVFDKETSKLRECTYNDFVIILDRSKYFDDYKKIFEYLNIPLTILKDGKLNYNTDILLIKNIFDFIIRIKNNDYKEEFKYDFISIARSFLYEYSDEKIFETFINNTFKDTKIYKDFNSIENINSKTSNEIFSEILNITDFYNKIYKIGDYENINVRLNTINNLTISLNEIGYSLEEFKEYLSSIIEDDLDMKYTTYSTNNDSVKILTIHKSKGLEYPICYFADLDHEFNMSDIKDKFILDQKYGIILSYLLEDDSPNLLKEIYKYNYSKEEISEKIRLFYVALTRAREKIILVLPNKDTNKLEKDEDGVIEKLRRISFNKLSSFIYGIKDYLEKYFKEIDIKDLNLTKEYLYKKQLKNEIKDSKESIKVEEININSNNIEEKHYSKKIEKVIDSQINKNIELGNIFHKTLELIDFKNYNPDLIKNDFIKNKITKFLNSELLNNIKEAKIYKEYEFIYTKNNDKYHGVIDLMLEYDNKIDIIDYKLNNIVDEKYKDQLDGYKNYIESITNKKVNTYLYSILDEKIEIISF